MIIAQPYITEKESADVTASGPLNSNGHKNILILESSQKFLEKHLHHIIKSGNSENQIPGLS